jgi:hypothetical protein
MEWALAPALAGAAIMTLFGVADAVRPGVLAWVGISASPPLGATILSGYWAA